MELILKKSIASMITAAQCRAARGLIRWSQQDLAQAGLSRYCRLSDQIEAGIKPASPTIGCSRRVLERAGVEFIDENGGGPGVRLRKAQRQKRPR